MIQRNPSDPAAQGRPVAKRYHAYPQAGFLVHGLVRRKHWAEPRRIHFVRDDPTNPDRDQQYAVIAPTLHYAYKRATEHTVVGERDMGDARLEYDAMTFAWFDHFLKGEDNGVLEKQPKVLY
jgi:hypothetical protein